MYAYTKIIFGFAQQDEEITALQKRISQLQSDVGSAKTQLLEATNKLEITNNQLADVSIVFEMNAPY